ncbi:MAG: MG2 domain-containing protein [Myxococcales bacterium]|nr:MG2 domain-containing protein [Myxococcales bacterium]
MGRLIDWWFILVIAQLISCKSVDAGLGRGAQQALHVVSFDYGASDAPEADDGAATQNPIRIGFDAPVVEAEAVGAWLAQAPLSIEPALHFRARYRDRQTLEVEPLSPLRAATRYTLSLKAPLHARLDRTEPLSFVHRPLSIERVAGLDSEWTASQPELWLEASDAVRAADVLEHCSLHSDDGKHGVKLETPEPERVASRIELATAEALKQGEGYLFECQGLPADGGNEPLATPFAMLFSVRPDAGVTLAIPSGSGKVTPDELRLELTFATPVSLDELKEKVTIKPEVKGFEQAWVARGPRRFSAEIDLAATTRYQLRVDGELRDRFGQRLGRDFVQRFETTDAKPRVQVQTGIYAIEARGEPYPLWSRNVGRVSLACAAVPASKITSVLAAGISYGPYHYRDEDEPLDFQGLGLRLVEREVKLSDVKNKWTLTHLDLPELCRSSNKSKARGGLYLAELRAPEVQGDDSRYYRRQPYRLLGNVTDLGVLMKAGPASGLVWVTRLSDGQPVAGAQVVLYGEGKRLWSGTSDASGLVHTPGTTELLSRSKPRTREDALGAYGQRLLAVVEKDDDRAIVDGRWYDGLQAWNFGVHSDRSPGLTRIRGLIQSDRGIYRPGETVHFKGLLREVAVAEPPRLPRARRVAVTVDDPRGERIYDRKLKLSAFGGFHFDLALPEAADLGDYTVRAELGGQSFRENFSVEEFRAVGFEITEPKGAKRDPMTLGEAMKFDFEVRYLFGAPVKNAEVHWEVQRRPHRARFAGYDRFDFDEAATDDDFYDFYDAYEGDTHYVTEDTARTDENGRVHIELRDRAESLDGPQDYLLRLRVQDASGQSVSKRIVATAHRSFRYLGLRHGRWAYRAGSDVNLELVSLDRDGQPMAGSATLSLTKRSWKCDYEGRYRVYSSCKREHKTLWTRALTLTTGTRAEHLRVEETGEYVVTLEANDGRGTRVAASSPLWIYGSGAGAWADYGSERISVIADRDRYQPGQQAKLLPRADTAGASVLVTLERAGIVEAFVVQPGSSGEAIDVALSSEHAPNVYASVAVVQGRRGQGDRYRPSMKLGVVELTVSAEQQRLQVEIATDKPSYEPGERVMGTVRVRDGHRPVRAELSLSAADQGVLALINYQTPDPMAAFYAPFGLGIDNSTNWTRVARLDAPDGADGGEEEGGDGPGGESPRVRSRFLASALWLPALTTDARGEARFAFVAPDNLTTFRLMAVAADRGARFGSGDHRIVVSKALVAKPVLPRFARSGDRMWVGAVIHNRSGAAGEALVTLETQGLWAKDGEQRVALEAGESKAALFAVSAGKRSEARVLLSVQLGEHHDAFEKRLPIERPLHSEWSTLHAGTLQGAKSFDLSWPEQVLPEESRLELRVDQTGLASLEPSLRYLIRYPYGCLEQTLSGVIPLVKVEDLARSMKLAELRDGKLERFIEQGVAKVLRHQHDDGHFSLWPGGTERPHLTAYAMMGLTEAQRAGVKVEARALEKGLDALRDWANGAERSLSPGGEIATMAMAAHVLAVHDRVDQGLLARLFEARSALPVYGKAFLLRALTRSGAKSTQRDGLLAELANALEGGDQGFGGWPSEGRARYMSSNTRDRAIALSALIEAAPGHPRIRPLVEELLSARGRSGRFGNTQENLYALIALADYARSLEGQVATVAVTLDGKRLLEKRIEGPAVLRLSRPLTKLGGGRLGLDSSQPVQLSLRQHFVREVKAPEPQADVLHVEREYLDPESGTALERVTRGQLVKVRLRVKSSESVYYLALSDALPAGFEAVNGKLATEGGQRQRDYDHAYDDGYGIWDHHALRDDAVWAFSDRLPAGTHVYEYLMRASVAGQFTAAPARAEAMYEPGLFASTAAMKLQVKP